MVADGLVDEGKDVGVVDAVDLPAAVSSDGDEIGEAKFGEVLADGGDGGTDLRGEGGDVTVAPLSEQPQDANPGRGRKEGERLGRFREVHRLGAP